MKLFKILYLIFLVSCSNTVIQKRSHVASNAHEIQPILNGVKIPPSQVRNIEGEPIDLATALLGENTVLVFYRGGWCPFCNMQLQGLRKIQKPLKNLGWNLVGISPDSPESLKKSAKRHNLKYTLYSDSQVNAAREFGLAFQIDSTTNMKYLGFGINLDSASGENHHILPVPGVYLINKKGIVVFSYVNPNYKVRLKESIILEAAKANR